jgi:hypothetical protein
MSFELLSPETTWAWSAILLLGAVHGVNPGMGWLFAVALGLQEEDGSAVWRSLLPLALGHAIAIGAALLLAFAVGLIIPLTALKWIVAALLIGVGVERLTRARHPRFGGMQVGARDLTIWSFLMASAHGAGLLVVPFVLQAAGGSGAAKHAAHVGAIEAGAGSQPYLLAGLSAEQLTGLSATIVHTIGYLVVTGLVAVLVYRKLGLRLLGKAWINLDLIWGAALVVTGLVTPFL